MKKLLSQIKRIFSSLRRLFAGVTNKATKGTGIAVKTVANTAGIGASFLVLIIILFVITLVAIPYGAFAAANNQTKEAIPTVEIVDKQDSFCDKCGVAEEALVKDKGKMLCANCLLNNIGGANEEDIQ
jgi:hypothetical protein